MNNWLSKAVALILIFFLFSCLRGKEVDFPHEGLEAKHLTYREQGFDIVRLDPASNELAFYLENEAGEKYRSLDKLKEALERKGKAVQFLMNGGMYLKDGSPQGLYIENGDQIKTVDTIQNAYGNFYLQPNGIFYIKDKKGVVVTTSSYLQSKPNPEFATQSGPMLVIENQVHPVFVEGSDNLNIRNGVGIDTSGKVVFAISHQKVNLYDFAMLFKEKLNCRNALYLDGFVSKAYIPAIDRKELGGNFGVMIGVSK